MSRGMLVLVDYLGANTLGRAPVFESRQQPAHSARFTFVDPAAHEFYSNSTTRCSTSQPMTA